MMRVTCANGIAVATVMAGPIYWIPAILIVAVQASPIEVIKGLAIGLIGLAVSVVFGGIVSIIPNVLGTILLAHLGCRFPAARHPLVWLLSGGILGFLIGLTVHIGDYLAGGALAFGGVGAACALICRRGTRWRD